MPRLLYLITGLGCGGAERQLYELAVRFRAKGWDVLVVSMLARGYYTSLLEEHGIVVETLGMKKGVPDPRAILRLNRLVRFYRPDVLHAHMYHANVLARVAMAMSGDTPLVCTAHSTQEGGLLCTVMYMLTDRWCNLTTNVSQAGIDRYRRCHLCDPNRSRAIPNGVDTTRYRPDSSTRALARRELGLSSEFVWIYLGRLDPVKDHRTAIRAFAMLLSRCDEARLLIVGDGPLRADLQQQAYSLGLSGQILFGGRREDVAPLLNAADAMVLSSTMEGLPMVLLEGAATGLPIVATRVGGNGEVVQQDVNGFLVPPGDPEALFEAMLRLMMQGRLGIGQMGSNSRKIAIEHYDARVIADTWEAEYRSLFARRNSVVHGDCQ